MNPSRVLVEITRAGDATAGATDPDTGEYTPGAPGAAYFTGAGDLLDEGPQTTFDTNGRPEYVADAQLFLRARGSVLRFNMSEGDTVTMTYATGRTVDAQVAKAVVFKDCLYLRRV